MRRQFHTLRKFGHRMQSVAVMGYESAVVDLMTELRRRRYRGLMVTDRCAAAVGPILLAPVLTEGSNS